MTGDAEHVKAAADLAAIIGRYVKLRRHGKNLVGLCPFHHEKSPSFTISPAKGQWYCFGCGAGGDVFTFIRRREGVNFPRALAIAADLSGVPLSGKPLTREQRREYAARQADRELLDHFRMIVGYPERESDRARAASRAACLADPEHLAWLREDLEHAKDTCALIVAMLARAQRRDGDFPSHAEATPQ